MIAQTEKIKYSQDRNGKRIESLGDDDVKTSEAITTVSDLGLWQGGMTPSKAVDANWKNGTIPWVTPKDMNTPKIDGTQDFITEYAVAQTGLKIFSENNIAVVFRSGVLRHTFPVSFAVIPFTVNQDLKVLELHANVFQDLLIIP